jgi:hypothetical protein
VCLVIALAAAVVLAWQRYFVTPPPFLGTWKNGRTAFVFHKDGRLDADGYFAEDGTFHEATRVTTGRWSMLAGNLLTLQGGKPGGELRPAARVQWKLGSDGKSLILSGLGRTDNFTSEVKLYAKPGS